MIDNFSLGLTHALMLYAAWRLFRRPDLDTPGISPSDARSIDPVAAPPPRWGRRDA